MDPRDLVLIIVGASPEGRVEGRTVLQKMGYFCSIILGLRVKYRPHYFGPYSSEVADAVSELVAIGALKESYFVTPWGNIRHDYGLTKEGEVLFEAVLGNEGSAEAKELVEKITREADWDNAQVISCAAKVDYILRKSDRPMTNHAIREEATALGWRLDDNTIDRVSSFLEALGFIEKV